MLTFGDIKDRVEHIVAEDIDPVILAGRIDEAQIEISKRFGKRSSQWYPVPVTEVASGVSVNDDIIHLDSGVNMPDPPAVVNLGNGPEAEKINYGTIVGDQLQDVKRGVGSTEANEWPVGTPVSIPVEAQMESDLPDDYLIVHEVRDLDNNPFFYYQISEEMQIAFFEEGLFKLIYTPVPEPIDYTDDNAKPVVHKAFHKDIVIYCVAKHWEDLAEGIQSEEQKAQGLLQQFYGNVDSSARALERNVNQQFELGFRLWS